jgi:CHAD domain-containing protein
MALDSGRIQNNIRKLRKIFKDPVTLRTPKRVHDLRTRTRRIEALLPAAQFASGRNAKRLLRALRRIRKRAGKVRNMDVLTSHLLELDVDRDREGNCAVQLIESLGEERYRQGKKLERKVRKRRAEIRERLKRLAGDLQSATAPNGGGNTDNAREPRVNAAASALELASALSEPKMLSRTNLHPYRLKVKQLRYVLKSAKGNTHAEFIDALGACKDAIGEWHDWEELAAIAGDVLDHGRECKLIAQLKIVARDKFGAALEVTNQMRAKFVPGHRAGKSARKPLPLKQPALQFANALARGKLAS